MLLLTLFVFVFEYFTLFEYIRIVSVFVNSIQYSYSFQIAKRILFGIRIRSKITIRPNTDLIELGNLLLKEWKQLHFVYISLCSVWIFRRLRSNWLGRIELQWLHSMSDFVPFSYRDMTLIQRCCIVHYSGTLSVYK